MHFYPKNLKGKDVRDHPFKTSACSRGGGVSPLLTFADARGVGVSGMPTSAIFDKFQFQVQHYIPYFRE
jgi:hypothetical protein